MVDETRWMDAATEITPSHIQRTERSHRCDSDTDAISRRRLFAIYRQLSVLTITFISDLRFQFFRNMRLEEINTTIRQHIIIIIIIIIIIT